MTHRQRQWCRPPGVGDGGLIGRIARSRRRSVAEAGFTLVELLVVVVILGILAAVVVFAVRGSGEKGRDAAADTDERIIRTALETYCAQKGRYPEDPDGVGTQFDPIDTLVGEKFLGSRSGYHTLATADDLPEGSCPATPKKYRLTGGPSGGPAPEDPCPVAKTWCDLGAGPAGNVIGGRSVAYPSMVQLSSGKVLVIEDDVTGQPAKTVLGQQSTTGIRTELYDPAAGKDGAWIPGPVAYNTQGDGFLITMALLKGVPGSACPSCGKVLAKFGNQAGATAESHWKLYDPNGDDGVEGTEGAWSEIDPASSPYFRGRYRSEALQLRNGKVVIHTWDGQTQSSANDTMVLELYDPRTNQFSEPQRYGGPGGWLWVYKPVELPDGRVVLAVGKAPSQLNGMTPWLFNPADGTIVKDSSAASNKYYDMNSPALLPDGGVLFVGQGPIAEIYRPGVLPGPWSTVPACQTDASYCHTIASLPNGKVLFRRASNINQRDDTSSKTMRLFDPAQGLWENAGSLQNARSVYSGVLLTGTPAQCATTLKFKCGKVLVAGQAGFAELYNP